jgi:hypothetical protein
VGCRSEYEIKTIFKWQTTSTILDTGAIVGNEGGNIESWADPRGDEEKRGRVIDKGGIRPAAGKISKK